MVAPYATVQEPRREIGTAILIPVNNPLERLLREIRRRTRVVGAFPDGQSALNLAAARLRHVAGTAPAFAGRPTGPPPVVNADRHLADRRPRLLISVSRRLMEISFSSRE
jgi:hypothetical protein